MARTVIMDTIKKDESATEMSVDGIVKAFAVIDNGTTPSIEKSLNISSLNDIGIGQRGLNFTSGMNDASYGVVGAIESGADDIHVYRNKTVNGYEARIYDSSSGVEDTPMTTSVLGDLA